MPLRQIPIVEWPSELAHLLVDAQIVAGGGGERYCRIDADVDAGTLLAIHEFEAHVRRRRVQLRMAGSTECITGEMNPCFGIAGASDRPHRTARLRISFCNLQDGDCIDEAGGD